MKESLLQGYLFAYTFWLNLSLGCLGLLLLQHLLKARWGLAVLRTLEAGALTIPVMAIACRGSGARPHPRAEAALPERALLPGPVVRLLRGVERAGDRAGPLVGAARCLG
jgi:hypothetical protein